MSETILRLNTADALPSPFNIERPIEQCRDLAEKIKAQGQLVPGLVRRHPTIPGKCEIIFGHRRHIACRLADVPFLALLHEGPLTDEEIIAMQYAENADREDMTDFERKEKIDQIMQVTGCTQGEAADRLGIDEAVASRAMRVGSNLAPSLRPLVESGQLKRSHSYYIAKLDNYEQQAALAEETVRRKLSKDAVAKQVAKLMGKTQKRTRKAKHKDEFGEVTYCMASTREQLIDWLGKLIALVKKNGVL